MGLAAVLAFAPGRGGDPAHPGTPCATERLAEVFAHVGRALRARLVRATESGRHVLQPAFGANGHFVFTDAAGSLQWLPVVERFLSRHGIDFAPLPKRA